MEVAHDVSFRNVEPSKFSNPHTNLETSNYFKCPNRSAILDAQVLPKTGKTGGRAGGRSGGPAGGRAGGYLDRETATCSF